MKIVVPVALLFLIGCKTEEKKEAAAMPGAYNMLSQHVKVDKTDTTYTDYAQLKIFTGDYMMYAGLNSPDSVSGFGIGSYTSSSDSVTETVIYSASDSAKSDSVSNYNLMIAKTPKGYRQVISGMQTSNGPLELTEEYETVGSADKSPLDGAWKQIKSYWIKGTDTTVNTGTQYKTYGAGHFIWGNTYADSTKKIHTGIGFGKFTMNGNKVKESVTASTYHEVRGKDVDIDVQMDGNDAFTQSYVNADSTKNVEVYQRLKK